MGGPCSIHGERTESNVLAKGPVGDLVGCEGNVKNLFLISNFRRVLYVVCFLLGNFAVSEFYMQTFRNTLFHLHRQVGKQCK
jgi:hypothetical protein